MEIKGDYIPSRSNSENKKPFLDEMTPNNLTTNTSDIMVPNLKAVNYLIHALKSYPSNVTCPFCKKQRLTKIEKNISIINLFCCIFTIGIGWLIWKSCRGKELNFYNVNHFCRMCNEKLSEYGAC
jgi:hypothetical protein